MMRIITGRARGVRLATLEGAATRPTAERAKEAIFSVLQFDLAGKRVLDLFAGSGQMGLEALSRGAASAVLVDSAAAAIRVIEENVRRTKLPATVAQTDALRYLGSAAQPFDLVFLDPPYAEKLVPLCLQLLLERHLLTQGAVVVCETGDPADVFGGDTVLENRFATRKSTRYGAAFVRILTPREETV